MELEVTAYDHVGIRVSERVRSTRFYASLGFTPDPRFDNERVSEMVTRSGVRINLIFNGERIADSHNVLLDDARKLPGFTHAAFIVDSLQAVLDWAAFHEIAITEGPVDWGRRLTCFVRDPDGNVIEFNEILLSAAP